MSRGKKVIIVTIGVIVALVLIGLLFWWFEPYFKIVERTDEELGYKYFISNNTVYLEKYIGEEAIVHVPGRIEGRNVIIYGDCFSYTEVEEVYVPTTVEIGDAFSYCLNLRKVQGGNNTEIYSGTFHGDIKLEEISFGNDIRKIGTGSFYGCASLQTVTFSEGLVHLGNEAFAYTGIVDLPELKNVEFLGNNVFMGTPWDAKQTEDFVVVGNTLQEYRGAEQDVHVPKGITAIRTAFSYKETDEHPIRVKRVYLPDTVKTLGRNAFSGQEDLTVYVPDSVTEIEVDQYGETYKMEGAVKIITTAGSYAEEYAKKYGIDYEIVDGWE